MSEPMGSIVFHHHPEPWSLLDQGSHWAVRDVRGVIITHVESPVTNDEFDGEPDRAERVQTVNSDGCYVTAIPEPLFLAFGRCKCNCGDKFKNREQYRGHFALAHILKLNTVKG